MRHLLSKHKAAILGMLLGLLAAALPSLSADAGTAGVIPYPPANGLLCLTPTPEAETDTVPTGRSRAERKRQGTTSADEATADSLTSESDSLPQSMEHPIAGDSLLFPRTREAEAKLDSVAKTLEAVKKPFIPDSRRATWLAAIFPGAGQIYNRKFWKLPIIYGGFLGCAYALSWNSKYYEDYTQAYLDIMDDDPKTDSYLDFLPINYRIEGREDWLKTVFRNKRNAFRRQRDLSIIAFIAVYVVSIIDAYVDAELSSFDISPDISLHLNPAVNLDQKTNHRSVGLQCSVNF